MQKLSMGWMVLAAACSGAAPDTEDGQDDDKQDVLTVARPTPAQTVGELADAGAPLVSGVIDCIGGDWSVYAWRLHPSSQRDAQGLPAHPPEVEVVVGSPGTYAVPVPRGPRRFVAAIEATTGTIAWSDAEGRGLPVHGAIAHLDLDCGLSPAPEGVTSVPQGEPVTAALVAEARRPVQLISEDGGPPTLKAQMRRGGRHFGGVHTERLIRARYAHRLSEEQLRVHMPMLLQLADDPASADAFVRRVGSTGAQL